MLISTTTKEYHTTEAHSFTVLYRYDLFTGDLIPPYGKWRLGSEKKMLLYVRLRVDVGNSMEVIWNKHT